MAVSRHDDKREPWAATDEDCETGYLVWAPNGLTEDEALAMFLRVFEREFGGSVRSVDNEPLGAELRPFREAREGDGWDEGSLVRCAPGEPHTEMVWVVEGIDWSMHG
jgi:hypothetical protein